MPFRVVYSARAVRQIEKLGRYIARRSSRRIAAIYIQRLQARCDDIAIAPFQGTRHDEFSSGIRTTGFERRVSIAFRVQGSTVLIVAVAYGGKRIERLL